NPGKEVEALEKDRRESFAQMLRGLSSGTNSAAAAAREAREAKKGKLIGTQGENFQPIRALWGFKRTADLKRKVVILDFFAHWCGPCIASLPSMRSLSDDLKAKGLQVIGVTRFYGYYKTENRTNRDLPAGTEFERMKDFVKEKEINWPAAFVDK